ncbi:MAG: AsmA-like C-terminal region-containing protein [Bacteroidia bacterium]
MKKWIKRIGIGLVIIFIILLILPFAFKGKILQAAEEAANKSVKAEIQFDRDISLSLIRNFPNLTVDIPNIRVIGKDSFENDTLYAANNTQFTIDIKSIIGGDQPISIKKIALENPSIQIIYLPSGKANYDIVPSDTTTMDTAISAPLDIHLESITIENANILYNDMSMSLVMATRGLNFEGSGKYSGDVFTLASIIASNSLDFEFDGSTFLSNVNTLVESEISMDLNTFRFTVNSLEAALNELPITANGFIQLNDEDIEFDFNTAVKSSEFKSFLSIVPGCFTPDFGDVKTSGKLGFSAAFKGIMDDNTMPNTKVDLTIENGRFHYPDLPKSVEDIQVDFHLNNAGGDPDQTIIDLKKLHLRLGADPIDIALYLNTPISNPYAKGSVLSNINLDNWKEAIPLSEGTVLNGKVSSSLQFDGHFSEIKNGNTEDLKMKGEIVVESLNYRDSTSPELKIKKVQMIAQINEFNLPVCILQYGKSDLSMTGKIQNALGFYLNGETLHGRLSVNSNKIDMNEILPSGESTIDSSASKEANSEIAAPEVPKNIDFVFTANAKKVTYDKYSLENCEMKVSVQNGKISINPIKANLCGSEFSLKEAEYAYEMGGKPGFKGVIGFNNISAQDISENISITQKFAPIVESITGILNFNMGMSTELTPNMDLEMNSLVANGNFQLIKGKMPIPQSLKNVFQQFNWNKAQDLVLKPIKAGFLIDNGSLKLKDSIVINLPKGSEMSLIGKVNLDQTIDFRGYLSAEGKSVPMHITGTLKNPKISIDWKAFGKKLIEDAKEKVIKEGKKELNKIAEDIIEKAEIQAEKIKAEAKVKADLIRTEGKKLADKQRAEGERLAEEALKKVNAEIDELLKKASSPLEKLAAKKASDGLKKEANKKAQKIKDTAFNSASKTESEANNKADRIETEAKDKADALIKEAREKQKENLQ